MWRNNCSSSFAVVIFRFLFLRFVPTRTLPVDTNHVHDFKTCSPLFTLMFNILRGATVSCTNNRVLSRLYSQVRAQMFLLVGTTPMRLELCLLVVKRVRFSKSLLYHLCCSFFKFVCKVSWNTFVDVNFMFLEISPELQAERSFDTVFTKTRTTTKIALSICVVKLRDLNSLRKCSCLFELQYFTSRSFLIYVEGCMKYIVLLIVL